MSEPILWTRLEAVCFRVVRPSVRVCVRLAGGVLSPACRQLLVFVFLCLHFIRYLSFSALTQLAGRQEEHPACTN